jgi:hypothetical protein
MNCFGRQTFHVVRILARMAALQLMTRLESSTQCSPSDQRTRTLIYRVQRRERERLHLHLRAITAQLRDAAMITSGAMVTTSKTPVWMRKVAGAATEREN